MKVKHLLLIIICMIFLTIIIVKNIDNNKVLETNEEVSTSHNALSIMLETSAGSGEYSESTSSIWPSEPYEFNSDLSYCENGSTLEYDDTTGAIKYSGRLTDMCYIYYDIVTYATSCNDSSGSCQVAQLSLTDFSIIEDDYGDYRYIGNEYCTYITEDGSYSYPYINGTCVTRYNYTSTSNWSSTNQASCPSDKTGSNYSNTYSCTSYEGTISDSDSTKCTYTDGSKTYTYSANSDGTCATRYNYTYTNVVYYTNQVNCPSNTSKYTYSCTAYDSETITGIEPNNYVTFNDETWRIIGVFDVDNGSGTTEKRIKLIRSEPLSITLMWDYKQSGVGTSTTSYGSNDWTDSQLMMYLNNSTGYSLPSGYTTTSGVIKDSNGHIVYQAGCAPASVTTSTTSYSCTSSSFTLTSTAQSQIADAVWYLGGIKDTISTASMFYALERGTDVYSGHATKWTGKVALMYPSDYGYATGGGNTYNREMCLTKEVGYFDSYSDCLGSNWLLDGLAGTNIASWETILSVYSESSDYNCPLSSLGGIGYGSTSNARAVRPVVYLKSSITITGGSGTSSDPYTLST